MVIVNIDKPLKSLTAHTNPDCTFVTRYMAETPYKGLGEIKRDGGWLQFDSEDGMTGDQVFLNFRNIHKYELIICSKC